MIFRIILVAILSTTYGLWPARGLIISRSSVPVFNVPLPASPSEIVTRVYDLREFQPPYSALELEWNQADHPSFLTDAQVTEAKKLDQRRQRIFEELLSQVRAEIDESSWKDRGGTTRVFRELAGHLIVTQTVANHVRIIRYLNNKLWLHRMFDATQHASTFTLSGVGIATAVAAAMQWRRKRRAMRKHLCVACGYDLRASHGRCPECGRDRNAFSCRKAFPRWLNACFSSGVSSAVVWFRCGMRNNGS